MSEKNKEIVWRKSSEAEKHEESRWQQNFDKQNIDTNTYYYYPNDSDTFKNKVVDDMGFTIHIYNPEGKRVYEYTVNSRGKKWSSAVIFYFQTMRAYGKEFYHIFKNHKLFAVPKSYSYLLDNLDLNNIRTITGGENRAEKETPSLFNENFTSSNSYTKENFLQEVFMTSEKYDILKNLLLKKKNIILQGSPGVGKTFSAKRLAYSILGTKNDNKIKMIQFHQNYSYEDFIMGYRPTETHFELKYGAFYSFCKEAEKDKENKYFFIIDEINRGQMSKIFGELLMLIEEDKRGESLPLVYNSENDKEFSVPKNLYIIGMMNTADRSLAMIDYALRRRFAFFDFIPAFNTQSFKIYAENKNSKQYLDLIEEVKNLNKDISESIGEGFQVGHSYFCTHESISNNWLLSVIDYEIIPLLKEYWFDEIEKVEEWTKKLKNSIKNN